MTQLFKKYRRIITTTMLCVILLVQNSCLTKAVWRYDNYQETVRQFYVGSDGRYVVLIGNQYHYIFYDDTNVFKTILGLRQRGILTVNHKNTYLQLDSHNNVKGKIVIKGPFDILPPEDINALRFLGFGPDKDYNITITIKLTGRRYQARYLNTNPAASIETDYRIPIYYYNSNLAKDIGKAAVTPITATLDAAILLGTIVLYPLYLPLKEI